MFKTKKGEKMAEQTNSMADGRFCTYENGKRVNHKKTVHALLQQCMDQGLTVAEARFVLNTAMSCLNSEVNKALLNTVLTLSPDFIDE